MKVKFMVRIGLLSAIGLLLQFISFPLPFFPEYLRYDAAELPALIAAFAIGPWAGVLVEFLKNFLSLVIGNAPSGIIGITANFIAGSTFAFVAGTVYMKIKTKKGAVLSLILGIIGTTTAMVIADYFWLLPLWGIPKNGALPLLVASIIPFNLTKGSITGILTFLLYKKVKVFFEVELNRRSIAGTK